MSKDSTIAILASFTALIVAILGLFKEKILEYLKFKLSSRKNTEALSDQFLMKYINALDILISDIQRLKDVIQLIVKAEGTNMDSDSAITGISTERKHIFESYNKHIADFEEEGKIVSHRAKNSSLDIESYIKNSLEGTKYVSEIPDKNRKELLEFRNDLTDAQNLLRDIKSTKLIRRIHNA